MKKVLSLIIIGIMLMSVCFAEAFSDMPDNWATSALENAVDNGLIGGSDGLIRPNDPLTRAEMATIVVRAFGATETADLSAFIDINTADWFYDAMSKAVAMGAFTGDGAYLNPKANISREQTFAVLARLFSLNYDAEINQWLDENKPLETKRYSSPDVVLAQFADGGEVAAWAKELVAAVISSGYVSGSDGRINPQSNITRAEFAVVMDRLVKTYIDTPGTYSDFPEGSVVIRTSGVTLNGADIKGDLVIGEGAENGAALVDTNVSDRYVARAGKGNTIKNGVFGTIRLIRPGVIVTGQDAARDVLYVEKDTNFVNDVIVNAGN